MAAFAGTVAVRGLRELQRDLKLISKEVHGDVRDELREAAEPVRAASVRLAVGNISHIGERWSEFRIGVTSKVVYVAPKARRRGGSPRPTLAPLLMTAMETALAENEGQLVGRVEAALDRLADKHGF